MSGKIDFYDIEVKTEARLSPFRHSVLLSRAQWSGSAICDGSLPESKSVNSSHSSSEDPNNECEEGKLSFSPSSVGLKSIPSMSIDQPFLIQRYWNTRATIPKNLWVVNYYRPMILIMPLLPQAWQQSQHYCTPPPPKIVTVITIANGAAADLQNDVILLPSTWKIFNFVICEKRKLRG